MSWTGRLNFLPFHGLTAASTAVCVCAGWQPVFAANSPQKDNDAAQMKLKYAAVDSPRLAKLDGVDIFTAISNETVASVALKINSSTLDSPVLANVVTEKTTDNSTTSEEEETAASDNATEAEASSTIPTTSEEIQDSNSTTESSTAVDDENKPEPLGFGDCDPYEPHDYYVDPSEPDEDTEAGPCRDEFRNWQKCIEVAKDREEDYMFACRCSVPTEIMAKCVTSHPEYYDNSDAEQEDSELEEEKEKGGDQIIKTNEDAEGVEEEETERVEGGQIIETAHHDSGSSNTADEE